MAKARFTCSVCGAIHGKWSGRCDDCGSWNSIVEERPRTSTSARRAFGQVLPLGQLSAGEPPLARTATGFDEFDRVLGGGLVPGAAVLVGGDPGIGKSTLLLQVAALVARAGARCIYISGEEAAAQVRMRAQRLGLADSPVELTAATALGDILATLESERPALAIVDSIQTLWSDAIGSAPGSVAQVRGAAHELTALAKQGATTVIMVGHVTKDGQIAGPRVVEHMVDTVLYFEGERGHAFRILRAVKNRFGPADEIGVWEMTGSGLAGVANPSELFLSERDRPAPGSAIFAGIEGTRPILCEIQALVAQAPAGQARRSVVGWDGGRLAMILAVLEARCGIPFAGLDVYLNVAGGLRVSEPAADLAVAAALLSAREDAALPEGAVVFGEIGLSGALRPAAQTETRLKEARKLGFTHAILPERGREGVGEGLQTSTFPDIGSFVGQVFGAG